MTFNIDDYVDVAERIRIFRDKHPDGSLQSEVKILQSADGFVIGVLCKATAYRSPDDPIPGNGHSYLGVPGKTPYTKDSEVENAETSAWGRAIVAALAADTKKVASADEVRAKHETSSSTAHRVGTQSSGGSGAVTAPPTTESPASHSDWTFPSGKHQGKPLSEVPLDYLTWYQGNGPKQDVKDQIALFLGGSFEDYDPDSDVPF